MKTCVQRYGLAAALVLALLALTSCEEPGFNAGQAAGILTAQPVKLEGEQVLISDDQITCGEQKDLWTVNRQPDGGGKAQLLPAAKALHFDDDVVMSDPLTGTPAWVQIRGDFRLAAPAIQKITDEDPQTKIISAKVGVIIDHPCFGPMPLLGIHKHQFTAAADPVFRFKLTDTWKVDQLVH
ncbi:MAG: hypothetical protein ABI824_15170 [Acidobacteriota bacterium]